MLLLAAPLGAETVFTRDGRFAGTIVRQNDKEVVLQAPKQPEVTLLRADITAIYDDDGNLVWSHPSIVREEPGTETARIEIPSTDLSGPYRGYHLGGTGGFGIIWPSGLLSSLPLGTTPDYHYTFQLHAVGAWYYLNSQAVTAGLGYARRHIPIAGIIESGVVNNGYWPMDYLDLRIGHRSQSGIFFIEPGLLTAINLTRAPLTTETSAGRNTNSSYGTPTYVALYLAIGAYFPVGRQMFILGGLRVEHAITAAVTGNAPTSTDVAGKVISTAPISLLPFSVSAEIGITWRLDLTAGR